MLEQLPLRTTRLELGLTVLQCLWLILGEFVRQYPASSKTCSFLYPARALIPLLGPDIIKLWDQELSSVKAVVVLLGL